MKYIFTSDIHFISDPKAGYKFIRRYERILRKGVERLHLVNNIFRARLLGGSCFIPRKIKGKRHERESIL